MGFFSYLILAWTYIQIRVRLFPYSSHFSIEGEGYQVPPHMNEQNPVN